MNKFYSKLREVFPWIIAGLVVLSGNCAAQAIYDSVEALLGGQEAKVSFVRLAYIIIFALMSFLLYLQRLKLFPPRTRYFRNDEAQKREHLVLFLSNIRQELESRGGIPEGLILTGDIAKDMSSIESFKIGKPNWPWEMPIRAIRHHLDAPLKTVTIICSKESLPQARLFVNICSRFESFSAISFQLLARNHGRTVIAPLVPDTSTDAMTGFAFESFDELTRAVWFLLKDFKRKGYPDAKVMIDITGGQKPTSIVGAAVTFNRKIRAQYVQTNHPWHVLSYDVIHVPSGTGEFGI